MGIKELKFRDQMHWTLEYEEWHKQCLKRDNFQCVKCGWKDNLTVHHKISVEELKKEYGITDIRDKRLWDTKNGQTLCERCHNRKEKRYAMATNRQTLSRNEERNT
jgi:5-methylcytosine-specific restriction endonuclease McrA